jgi:hypothetical protein
VTRGHRAGTWRATLHTGASGQRSASKAHDRDRPAGYPGATCHRPPRDPHRHQMQASPNDHAGHPLPSGVRQARQHRDRGSTTTSHAQPAGHHWTVPIALSTADLGHSEGSLPVLAGPAKSAADPPFFLVPGVTSSRCSIRGQPRDRLAQAAARQCPAAILLTGGSSRKRVGWCGDPQFCDHESLGVLFPYWPAYQPGPSSGLEDRYASRTRVPEATCPGRGALSRRVHLRSG